MKSGKNVRRSGQFKGDDRLEKVMPISTECRMQSSTDVYGSNKEV